MTNWPAVTETTETASDSMVARCRVLERNRNFEGVRREALRFLARDRSDAVALTLLGRAEFRLGRPERAVAPFRRCTRQSNHFIFHLLYAHCLKTLGREKEARVTMEETGHMMPASGSAFFTAAVAFEEMGEIGLAIQFYRQSLTLEPNVACVHHRLGRILLDHGQLEEALDQIGQAVAGQPKDVNYHLDHGVVLELLGRFEESLRAVEKALAIEPKNGESLHNRSHLLLLLNRPEAAVAAADHALEVGPAYPETLFTRATALLKAGRWKEGWQQYEWRWRSCQTPRADIRCPPWQGENLRGRHILLHAEQGLGDSLQFVRFVTLVSRMGARVSLQVPPPLVRLFQRVEGATAVFSDLPDDAVVDCHCPLGSLPLMFGVTPETVPGVPYLSAAPEEAARQGSMVRRLVENGYHNEEDIIVGLVWSGSPRKHKLRSYALDKRRSVQLTELAPLFSIPGVRFASFQLDEAAAQQVETGLPVADVTAGIRDFADTAARLTAVDLLISVDTSIVHLAGGMGLPVWMLSRSDGCWRWMKEQSDTPWYPTMKILRQQTPGIWSEPVEEVKQMLERLVKQRRRIVAEAR